MRALLLLVVLIVPVALAQDPPAGTTSPDAAALVQDLGSPDYETREKATRALESLGPKARAALEAVKDSGNLEQRTRARRLLDAIDARPVRPADPERLRDRLRQRLRPVEPGGQAPPTPKVEVRPQRRPLRFGELPRREQFGRTEEYLDALRRFLDESFRPQVLQRSPFEDLLRRRLGDLARLDPGSAQGTTRIVQNDRSLELTRGADGRITFKVGRVGANGRTEAEEVYEAESLDDFKARHGEVYDRYRDTGLFDSSRHGFRIIVPGDLRPVPSPLVRRPRGRTLGVVVGSVPAVLRAHLEVPEKAVIVEEVRAGTVAATMGLKVHDLLTHVDGQPVGSAAEVRERLDAAGEEVRIRVLRRGKSRELTGRLPR